MKAYRVLQLHDSIPLLPSFVKLRLTANYRRIIVYITRSAQTSAGDEVKVYETTLTATLLFFYIVYSRKKNARVLRNSVTERGCLARRLKRTENPTLPPWNGTALAPRQRQRNVFPGAGRKSL